MSQHPRGAHFARALHLHHPLRKHGGRREGRVAACTRALAQKRIARARKPQVQAVITPAFPAQWFYGLYVLSSVNHPVCHRHLSRSLSASLELSAGSVGRRDHTTSPSANLPDVNRHIPVHRIPLHVRDDAYAPSIGTERGGLKHTFRKYETYLFFTEGLDKTKPTGLPSAKVICPTCSSRARCFSFTVL